MTRVFDVLIIASLITLFVMSVMGHGWLWSLGIVFGTFVLCGLLTKLINLYLERDDDESRDS